MSNNKFEQLIELFINEDEKKAKELFHDIVVEKSRDIYADLIKEDEVEDIEENTEEEVEEATDEEVEEATDEEVEEDLGGNETEDLINDIESDEEGLANEEHDGATDEEVDELSDAIADLQKQFDDIVAMNDLETGDDAEGEDDMDMEMDMEEPMDMEDDMEESVAEEKIVEYKEKAPAPVSGEEASVNKTEMKTPGGKPSSDAKPAMSAGSADEKGGATPKSQSMNATTKPDLKKV
jgi:hypothetical protein